MSRFRTPDGTRIYAIGDIHGRLDLLEELHARIESDLEQAPVASSVEIYLGDYIDRGPHSAQVLDRLLQPAVAARRVCLLGNHEAVFLSALHSYGVFRDWLAFGGIETLLSYGISPQRGEVGRRETYAEFRKRVPERHTAFLRGLGRQTRMGGYLFVHAGVNPVRPLDAQDPEDLISIREPFLSSRGEFGCLIVHGHTPTEAPDIRSNRINIDTGAFLSGRLTCLALEGEERRLLHASV